MEILRLIHREDVKSARLVCTKWFRMLSTVHPHSFCLNENNSERLEILKKSFHPTSEGFVVSNYTESLPIHTSTRSGIPKAQSIYLHRGNSVENILKLLRYYAKCYDSIALFPNCLENVAPFRLKGLTYESLHSLDLLVSF